MAAESSSFQPFPSVFVVADDAMDKLLVEKRPNSRWLEMLDTSPSIALDGTSSILRLSEADFSVWPTRIRFASDRRDAKPLIDEDARETTLILSMSMSGSWPSSGGMFEDWSSATDVAASTARH